MTQESKFWKVVAVIVLGLALVAGAVLIGVNIAPEVPVARGQCDVYMEQGCAKFVAESGGEIEMQSGATLDVQSGVATTFGGDVTIAGTCSGCSIDETSNIAITGTLEVTGATSLNSTLDVDGATTLNSTLDVDGNITSGTGAVTVTDSVNITGAVDCDSTLNVDGALTLVALLYPSFADETITDGETLTPTKTIYALDSAGAVTMTLAASGTEGQLLILIGDDANDITINDTNVRTNDGGVQVIGQYDVITWVYQDSEWVEISESNNS